MVTIPTCLRALSSEICGASSETGISTLTLHGPKVECPVALSRVLLVRALVSITEMNAQVQNPESDSRVTSIGQARVLMRHCAGWRVGEDDKGPALDVRDPRGRHGVRGAAHTRQTSEIDLIHVWQRQNGLCDPHPRIRRAKTIFIRTQ